MKCPHCDHENPANSRFCSHCASPLTPSQTEENSLTQTFDEPPSVLERGRLFAGRYEVIEELGSGGMGKVYKVYDTKIKEVIALKIIRPEIASRPKTLARFREEIRLARKISHKNICRMHDLNEAGGISFFTMEYVPGEDLKRILRMVGRLRVGQAIFIARQVCAGLAEAHRLGIIHRDLKPKNILIDYDGNVRIMDFGLARSLEEKGITGGRAMLGTAEYMSPEQAEGEKADNRSDIYSLGVILFEMVTGQTPFEGDSALSIALKHKTEPAPDPGKLNPEIPERLRRIILKCLEKTKEKRFQSVEELASELESLEKEYPSEERIIRAKKASLSQEMSHLLRPKKIALSALALISVFFMALFLLPNLWKKKAPLISSIKPSLVVLPFKNNTGDENLEVWREALAESLIAELRRSSPHLLLLSADTVRTSIRKLGLERVSSFSSEDLRKIAADTGASHILVGSYSRTRMYYDLKDVRTETIISSGRTEGEGEKDFERMADGLKEQILSGLKISAPTEPRRAIPTSTMANHYYLLGRRAERNLKDTADKQFLSTAVSFFEKALAEDPNFPLPYWGLGDIYQSLYVRTKDPADLEICVRNYEKAYQLAPDLAGPNLGLGWAYFLKGNNDKAFVHFQRSLELDPQNPEVHRGIGSFFRSIGLLESAVRFYTTAIEKGESSPLAYRLSASCLERLCRFEEAEQAARFAYEKEPDNARSALFYARMLISQRNLEAAEKEIDFAEKLAPGLLDVRLSRALLFAARGQKEKALPLLEETKKSPVYYSYLLSRVYGLLGMKKEALDIIQLGIEKGFQETQEYLFEYPFLEKSYFFESLREEPRWRALLEKQRNFYLENLRKYGSL